ncbi:immunoglobulin-like domain-containing protein [Listeria newyorkensis]|uniref:Bacterial Ig domain-containing protein n=1 Tax=Listeria newyorkensis TaxID=1497681 RepID=A0A841YUN0_9LIST|nr:immunoglobulin-like domain-containing protein [Listeria newyorkensis]MBC1457174.1 hypothetical protein [Listeria newyorkensis]
MTKKKNMKKMLNVLTAKAIIVSSISGAVLTPSLTALAAEDQNVVGAASTGTQSDGLLNFNWELDSASKLKYWISQSSVAVATSNSDKYSKAGNVLTTADGLKTITVNGENSFTFTSTSLSQAIAQTVTTEIGKEYTISTRVQQTGLPTSAEGAKLMVDGETIKPTTKDELASYTFTATSTSAKISFINHKNGVGTRSVTFGDIYAGKSTAQLAKDNAVTNARTAVNNLFEDQNPNGQIRADLTQAEIDAAQKLIFAIGSLSAKQPISNDLKKAQTQLDERNAQGNAELEAAENAVKALFNNDDVTGTIKDTTNQAAIDNAKELVAAIKDADKKAELEAQTAEAQKQLDAKTAETDAEQARQEAATNAVKALFNNNDVTGTIKDTTNQAAIDNAKELVAAIKDADKKAELEAQTAEAQKQLDAKTAETDAEQARQEAATNAVKALFNNNDVTGTIKDATNQAAIDNAKELVAAVKDADKKAELEAQIAEVQKQLDAKSEAATEQTRQEAAENAVKDLFNNNDVTGTIKDNTTQEAINNAKELVAAVKDADKKAELEAQLAEAQKQLTEKETKVEVTGKGNTFILQQDRYLTGTYTGDVTSMTVEVNGKLYYGGTVKNGEFSFYALDKIASTNDTVIVNLHSADKTIQASFPVTVKEATKVTQNAYKVTDSNITGTFNNADITKMGVVVNGKAYWGGTVANGEFKFYSLDKIASPTDEVVLNFYNANNELIISKNLVITAPVVTSGDITSATLAVGDKNIVGTITGDIKSFGVTIDGTTYSGGTIAADGTFKFYVADKKFTADSVITIVGYDKSKKVLSEMNLVVSK